MEHVLPAIKTKTKRKKRKPMPPWLKFWLLIAFFDLAGMLQDLMEILVNKNVTKNSIAFMFVGAVFAGIVWPNLKREWDAWKRDNDE